MELLDRYLQSVKFWLPKAQQDDILKELNENIRSQMEDKEGELGRPLSEAEQSAILKRHGHPILVASRYCDRQHLIVPALFPIYWFVLRLVLVITVASSLISQIATASGGKPAGDIVLAILQIPNVALMTFAWVTIVFAAIDWANTKFRLGEGWDPRSLPKVAERGRKSSRRNPIFELLAWLVAILWWALIPSFPFVVFGPAAAFIKLTPVWQDIHLPVLLILLVPLALEAAKGIRPDWGWLGPVAHVGRSLASLSMLSILINAGPLVSVMGELATNKTMVDLVQLNIKLALIVASIICVVQLAFQIIGLIRTAGRGAFSAVL